MPNSSNSPKKSDTKIYDIVVIGAGLAGLTCAKQLQHRGYQAIVLDKSRGVGGRVTTRRIDDLRVDRGLPWIEEQGEQTTRLIKNLKDKNILKLWQGKVYQLDRQNQLQSIPDRDRYIPPEGINAIAKYLASDLEIIKQFRVTNLRVSEEKTWQILDDSDNSFYGKAVVVAIPAPQALAILQPLAATLPTDFIEQIETVKYHPCITATAGYSKKYLSALPVWQFLKLSANNNLEKVILDSSKRKHSSQPVLIFHSTPQFATQYLDTENLQPAGKQLLQTASSLLLPWLNTPQWMQVHRWRYAIPSQPLKDNYVATNSPLPLVCCGDWCNGNNIESALVSGTKSVSIIDSML